MLIATSSVGDQMTQAVSQVAPAKAGLSKKAKIIIASVVGAIVLVAFSFGGTYVYAPARW